MSQCCGISGARPELDYVLGEKYNPILYKPKIIRGKKYVRHSALTTKCEAKSVQEGLKSRGNLAAIIPLKVWVKRHGWGLGTEKIQMWVVYVHYKKALMVEV